ncbi:uncharacterized protein LOC129796456 isoform X2 [Lutzomyia longipalpis]|uniref:uncharacterized protein LOC129796456 isoform X2 n=1 Tax=Lutzomyia longipalpis TaxID=7200 RepID=UPI0024834276|nr:uncharacterized protein LOC129796456 isoform X2 [Lutzomyia longipalpis]
MLLHSLRAFFLLPIAFVVAWKPIVGPPAAFTLKQTLPAVATSVASFNGDEYLDTQSQAASNPYIDSEERILNGKFSYAANSIFNTGLTGPLDSCSVDKYALEHEGTLQYDKTLPKLDQFTLCAWMRFTNHSGDHTIFTYSVNGEDREIQLWVANSKGSSFISLAVHGQSLYRLNYPLRFRQWHHACTSWNGKTGEWQLWIKAERVGRGFHNRLVNYQIKGNGIIFSGGPSITGTVAEGLHTEVTMIQLYKVALSAGKAHRDHKHHHVHHFDHNGPITSTAPPPTNPPQPVQPVNPLLANGQIATRVRLNLAGVQNQPEAPNVLPGQPGAPVHGLPSQLVGGLLPQQQGATITTQFINGQFHTGGRLLSEQLVSGNLLGGITPRPPNTLTFPGPVVSSPAPSLGATSFAELGNSANVQFIDDSTNTRFLFKREDKSTAAAEEEDTQVDDKKVKKRGLIMLSDGAIIDDSLLGRDPEILEGLTQFGEQSFRDSLSRDEGIEDEIREHDREPAEGEVRAVMNLCTSCDHEPFLGAIVLAWKDLHVSMSHALKAKTSGICGQF